MVNTNRRHQRDQHDLAEHGDIAGNADRERSEQGRGLLSPREAYEPAADEAGEREQYDRAAAANGAALQAEPQKMPLETAGDEAVLGADEMQNLNHRMVAAITKSKIATPAATAVPAMARMRSIQPR